MNRKKGVGRPRSELYKDLVRRLKPSVLYSPGLAVQGWGDDHPEPRLARSRARIALHHFARGHLCKGGDGTVVAGQRPAPGWFGKSWQRAYLGEPEA